MRKLAAVIIGCAAVACAIGRLLGRRSATYPPPAPPWIIDDGEGL